jgi:DNA-binding Xre family transcriptional regulator
MAASARKIGPFMKAIASVLRDEARNQHVGITLLSIKAGVPTPTVSKSLAGKHMIDVEELRKLCFALNVHPGEIFDRAMKTIENLDHDAQGGPVEKQNKIREILG